MKKLPIGIQTLTEIIEEGYVYVDKTSFAHRLITSGKYYFLSRPRRFGKSLFLDTLKEIFECNKSLFKGLYIYDKWNWQTPHPVLRISLGSGAIKNIEELQDRLRWILEKTEDDLSIKCTSNNPVKCFQELILKSYQKYNQKVVILIDEYDKPILDNITNSSLAREMRDEMKDFFSIIKDNDAFIRLVFITGVSKFSKINLFSGLNNLEDITLNADYGNICGYTHKDLLTVFKNLLKGADVNKVQKWYNGYNYFGEKVYNPFDILLFISNKFTYKNYWWSTGNPSFLIEMLQTKNYFIPSLENLYVTEEVLDAFDVEKIELVSLLWQTGYLTIKAKSEHLMGIEYRLGIPNKEIQLSLNSLFITYLTEQTHEKLAQQKSLLNTLLSGNISGFRDALQALFSTIPYHNFTKNDILEYEGYYASVVYAYLASLGMDIIPEDTTNLGRIDLTMKHDDMVFVIEFKLREQPTGDALRQIKEKRYYDKYVNFSEIYLIGIEFSREKRNIIGFEWERL